MCSTFSWPSFEVCFRCQGAVGLPPKPHSRGNAASCPWHKQFQVTSVSTVPRQLLFPFNSGNGTSALRRQRTTAGLRGRGSLGQSHKFTCAARAPEESRRPRGLFDGGPRGRPRPHLAEPQNHRPFLARSAGPRRTPPGAGPGGGEEPPSARSEMTALDSFPKHRCAKSHRGPDIWENWVWHGSAL